MKTCYVMRGIPGSGKSSWLRALPEFQSANNICSADDYHLVYPQMTVGVERAKPTYVFRPENARDAHNKCMHEFVSLATCNAPVLAVDNTNIRVWELAAYVRVAEAFKYEIKIVRMICDPFTAHGRNVHGVPLETIWRMHSEMENLPPIWKEIPVIGNRSL